MSGDDQQQGGAFSYVTPEARIPKDHPKNRGSYRERRCDPDT
jgi:hypothetical protein